MNNKSGLVVIAAGIAAFLVIKGGRDSGSLFGSGGGDSGQPTGTILAGPGTSSPASSPAPSSLWSPSPTNNSPQSFGYVTPTGTYITPFRISDKIIAAMQNQNQNQNQLGYSNPSAYNPVPSNVKDANILNNIFGNNAANIPKLNLSQYSGSGSDNKPSITPKNNAFNPTFTNLSTPFTTPATAGRINSRPIKNNPINTGLDKYGYKIGSQWSPAYAEAGGYHGDSRNYATAVQLKRVPGLFVSSTGVHTAPRY